MEIGEGFLFLTPPPFSSFLVLSCVLSEPGPSAQNACSFCRDICQALARMRKWREEWWISLTNGDGSDSDDEIGNERRQYHCDTERVTTVRDGSERGYLRGNIILSGYPILVNVAAIQRELM